MRRKTKWTLGILLSLVLLVGLMLGMSATAYADGNVAKIGNTEYATLQAAIDACPKDGTATTITLLQNVDLGTGATTLLVIPATADLTLDLNGHTISGSTTVVGARIINNNGTLVIRDSSASKTGEIKNISTTNNECIRTLGNGTDTNHTASMTIESGKISSTVGQVIINQANLKIEKDVVLETTATFTGNFSNGAVVLDNRAPGIVKIDGATLTSNDGMLMFIYPASGSNVSINGGTFTAKETRGLIGGSGAGDVKITGGTFNIDPSALVAQGYYVEEANNLYTVKKMEESTDFTVSSEEELSQALSESSPSKPVKITISGNISVEGNLKLLKGSSITIPQGNSLSVADGGVLMLEGAVENQGTLTIAKDGFLGNPLSVKGDGDFTYEGYDETALTYSISSPMGLQWLAVVNNGDLIDDLEVEVTQDIVFPNGVVFQQIPYFCGTFDGMNHTISGLVINAVSSHTGVFTGMSYATIKNVTLDATITANNGTIGGVAGYVGEDTHFQNVKTAGSITVGGSGHGASGFVGAVSGQDADKFITFENCESSMTISAPNASIVGGFYGTASSNETPIDVMDCTYSGNMTSGGYCATVGGYMSNYASGKTTVYGHTIKGTVTGVYTLGKFIDGVMVLGADGHGEIKDQGAASVGDTIYSDISEAVAAAVAQKKPLSLNMNMNTAVDVVLTNEDDVFMLQQNGFTENFNVTYGGTDVSKTIRTRVDTNITVKYVGPIEIEVTFTSAHGTAPAKQTVDYGAKVKDPGALTADGWVFENWYKEDSFQTLWNFATDTVTEPLTLFAKWSPVVAKIGDNEYTSLRAAVDAAQSGDTITLVADDKVSLTDGSELEINIPITITGPVDTNGDPLYTIYGKSDANVHASGVYHDIFVTASTGTVTISNVKIAQFANQVNSKIGVAPLFVSSNNHKAVFDNVTVSDINCTGIKINGGEFEIKNCTIDCAKTTGTIYTKGVEIVNAATGAITGTTIVNVTGASNCAVAGIEAQGSGDVAVTGCTITGTNTYACGVSTSTNDGYTDGSSKVTVSESTITAENPLYNDSDQGAKIIVSSGAYDGVLYSTEENVITISGGKFSFDPEDKMMEQGYAVFDNTDTDKETYPFIVLPSVTVTFNANDGAGTDPVTQNVKKNIATALAENSFTAPTGKQFGSWNTLASPTEENPGKSYADKEEVTLSENLTLYAQWILPPATVETAPKAKTLNYTGSAQALVEAGTATGGTMQYALGTDD